MGPFHSQSFKEELLCFGFKNIGEGNKSLKQVGGVHVRR